MEKIVSDWSTNVRMTDLEAQNVCRLGQGEACCAFLAIDAMGFNCIRMDYPVNTSIFSRLEAGKTNAKGRGGWPGCAWENEL